jgi:4-hydroxy-tetrahydrodipicolinate reductase
MAKIAIMGSDGEMGRKVAKIAQADGEFEIVAGFTVDVSPNVGADLGVLASGEASGVIIQPMQYFKEIMESARPDVLIDFTLPEGTETSTKWAISEGFPAVIGTTGLSPAFMTWVNEAAEEKGVTVVISSNYATGMNILFKISAELAKLLPGWDIEITETHHHRKRDSPSGTALRIASGIAQALDQDLDEVAKYGRDKGPNPRKLGEKEIGIHAIRAGDIVGDHVVLYAGAGEVIELTHRATSRECFAQGAAKAAKYVIKNPNLGRVLSMLDVLEL